MPIYVFMFKISSQFSSEDYYLFILIKKEFVCTYLFYFTFASNAFIFLSLTPILLNFIILMTSIHISPAI